MTPGVEDKRQAILDAALELFADRGYHGTSVALIANKARVGAGTIYRYFADKDVLVNTLYRDWKEALSRALLDDLPGEASPRLLFHHLWSRMVDFTAQHPKVLIFLKFHHHAPYLDQESLMVEARWMAQFERFFQDLQETQAIKSAPPPLLWGILIGAFIGMQKVFFAREVEPSPANLDLAEDICWEAIRR